MSYAYCIDRLTNDQKTRSRAMLENTGISLIYSKGDEAPINYSTTLANASCSPQTDSAGLSGFYTGIKNFTIDGIFTNTSSWSETDGGYVDNTLNCQKVINVFEDSTYTFEVYLHNLIFKWQSLYFLHLYRALPIIGFAMPFIIILEGLIRFMPHTFG